MNHYETLFIVKPTLTEEEIISQVERVKEIISAEGGELVACDTIGMRKLAYPVEKQERGYYTVVYFSAPATAISELERQLRYNENILRFMTVKYMNKKETAQFEKMAEAVNKKSAEPSKETGEAVSSTDNEVPEAAEA